jgi:serine/threonine protein phosphatase PrpC
MKISRKIIVVSLLVLGLAPALVGCGGESSAVDAAIAVETTPVPPDTTIATSTSDDPIQTDKADMTATVDTVAVDPVGNESDGTSFFAILIMFFLICGFILLVVKLARSGNFQSRAPIRSVDIGRSPRQPKPERLVPIGIIPDTFPEQKTPLKALLQDEVITEKLPETIASPVITTPAPVRPTLSTSVNFNSKDAGDPLDERVSNRVIISPKQIAEPSSFARHDWWDKGRDWCQISPLGMSNDVVCDIGTSGSLAVAAVSLRGHKHKVDSKACQDAFGLRIATSGSGEEYLIVVVCDGMSSAKYSHYGARRTSQLLARSLAEIISVEESVTELSIRTRLPNAFDSCRRNLLPRSGNQYGAPDVPANGAVESDFYTTVTFMILPNAKQAQGKVNVIVGSIGDSPVFTLREETGEWAEVGGLGANSDIVNPATSAFPAVFDAQIQTVEIDEKDVIIATSDGVGNFLNVRGGQTLLGSYLAEQWIRPVNLPTFINDVGFDLKSADDDRTVVAVWPNRG